MQHTCNNLGVTLAQDCVESIGRDYAMGWKWVQSLFEARAGKGEMRCGNCQRDSMRWNGNGNVISNLAWYKLTKFSFIFEMSFTLFTSFIFFWTYPKIKLAWHLLVPFFILSKKIYWHILSVLYSLSRDVRRCPLNVALRIISQMLFEIKKLFALVKCHCGINPYWTWTKIKLMHWRWNLHHWTLNLLMRKEPTNQQKNCNRLLMLLQS